MKKSNLGAILLISSFLLMPPEGYGSHEVDEPQAQARPRAYVGNEALGMADMDSGGELSTVKIMGLSNISDYAFDGSDLSIPFTLDGTQTGEATVWLIVYTSEQHPPLTMYQRPVSGSAERTARRPWSWRN